VFFLKSRQQLQLLLQLCKQPLTRFDRVTGRGEEPLEELICFVWWCLAEPSVRLGPSQIIKETVASPAAWTASCDTRVSTGSKLLRTTENWTDNTARQPTNSSGVDWLLNFQGSRPQTKSLAERLILGLD
jgi:hypothetical protein